MAEGDKVEVIEYVGEDSARVRTPKKRWQKRAANDVRVIPLAALYPPELVRAVGCSILRWWGYV